MKKWLPIISFLCVLAAQTKEVPLSPVVTY
ncbi:uncharacterized protein METZ01_LOCUS205121, partial [marine metagenome]